MRNIAPQEGLVERAYWLIRLRWIAVAGVVLTVLFVEKVVNVPLESFALYAIAVAIGLYNSAFFSYLNRIRKTNPPNPATIVNRVANVQISSDLLSLTALIHFSGGVENPFIFYFIFHVIIASILLTRRASYFQATFAVFLFISMVNLEYFNVLRHYSLKGFIDSSLYANSIYVSGISLVFISTLYLAVYMASSISVKLRQREKSLEEANLLLEEKDRIKSNYVLRVSHDIKEHLSTIQGCLDPVLQELTGELNSGQKDLIRRAVHRTGKLTFFVKALLEITRIKLSREIEMSRFSLRKTIDNTVNFVEAKAKDKDIAFNYNLDPGVDVIKGAQVYIEETIANLLANSVKYTPRGGKVDMEIRDRGDSVLIQVSDTGIGIPKVDIPNIFGEFYRAGNARALERDGTGLGLAIAKEVVERHNGKIWVESVEGKGSIFSILLPK